MNQAIIDIKEEARKKGCEMTPFALILYETVLETKPDVVFEIGVRKGYSTRAILSALVDNEKGKLYSCDIRENKCVVPPNLREYWDFIRISSENYAKEWKLPIDILIIDGDHHYEAVKKDFENYIGFVKQDGYIFMHDVVSRQGVRDYFPEIKYPKVILGWSEGLGIVRKL